MTVAAVVAVFAVMGIEILHHRTWHHYFGFGIHTHVLKEEIDIAIPGVRNMYAVTAANYTASPILMRGCKGPSDVSPFYEITYRYQVEKREPASATWSKIMAIPPECPGADLVSKTFLPGETMEEWNWKRLALEMGFIRVIWHASLSFHPSMRAMIAGNNGQSFHRHSLSKTKSSNLRYPIE